MARDRKWDVQLELAPPVDVHLAGAKVTVALTRHLFRFGCNAFHLSGGAEETLQSAVTRSVLTPCSTMPRSPFTGATMSARPA